ncbi:transglutaminase domain-containing protein [Butyrivibrio sp. XB500-5]|nr:transglutaminase domain-containing protein [Butyrivibrio sp. XB500-5]
MAMKRSSSSEKDQRAEKNTVLLSDEFQLHIFVFSLLVICLESLTFLGSSFDAYYSQSFIFATIAFFAFYACIGHVFEMFVGKRVSAVFSVLPSVLIFFLLNKSAFQGIAASALLAAVLRIVFVLLPKKKTVITIGSFVLGALSLYLYFEKDAEFAGKITATVLFVSILILILSSVQKIFCEKKLFQTREAFPFYFFMILGLLVLVIPKPEKPIDWTKALEFGDRFISSFNYYMPDIFSGETYKSGYSNLGVTGGKVSLSDTTQLKLKTYERPYFVLEDESGAKIKRRRTMYLSGGKGSDKTQIVTFVNFLHNNNIDKETAKLFSEIGSIQLEYAYLKTNDEIAPLNALYLESAGKAVEGGRASSVHKKGYALNVTYLNIDYGSPYLSELLRDNGKNMEAMSFDEACDYFRKTYGPNLDKYVSREEYDAVCAKGFSVNSVFEYLDTNGAGAELSMLAKELTEGVSSDYDKCRTIEKYLRQYKYSTDVESTGNTTYDINTSKGASALAERFLFETGEGYCIHYTSSMVMLLRLSGIPARACVGYHYVFPFEKADSYDVSGRCAHAWPEAYIENVGWVPFEPTSAYRSQEDNTWNRVRVEETEQVQYGYEPSHAPVITPDKADDDDDNKEKSLAYELIRVVLPVIASVVILLLVLVFGIKAIQNIRYRLASLDKKLEMDVAGIKKSVRKKSADNFTDRGLLSDYVKRIPSEFQTQAKEVFGAYYRMVYGGDGALPITGGDVMKARELYGELSRKIKK